MSDIGPLEIVALLAPALLFFGPGKLPEMGRGLGKGLREFKDAASRISRDEEPVANNPAERPPTA